jgi:hypothetical protein
VKRPGCWTLLLGLYGLYFIVYEGGIMAAMLLLATFAFAFWLHREKRPGECWRRPEQETAGTENSCSWIRDQIFTAAGRGEAPHVDR